MTRRAPSRLSETGFGLSVVHQEELSAPPVLLTYLDCGNIFLQLVEPTDPRSALAILIEEQGEGLNHICFGVDDVLTDAAALAPGAPRHAVVPGEGRGRLSAFVPGPAPWRQVRMHRVPTRGHRAGRRAPVTGSLTDNWLTPTWQVARLVAPRLSSALLLAGPELASSRKTRQPARR